MWRRISFCLGIRNLINSGFIFYMYGIYRSIIRSASVMCFHLLFLFYFAKSIIGPFLVMCFGYVFKHISRVLHVHVQNLFDFHSLKTCMLYSFEKGPRIKILLREAFVVVNTLIILHQAYLQITCL